MSAVRERKARIAAERERRGAGSAGALAFRNVEASPDDPVSEWPLEAIEAALERGGLAHWRRLAEAIRAEPWGPVARQVEEVLGYSRPYGVAEVMERAIANARADAEVAERVEVAAEIARLVEESGLSRAEFASRAGTSASRFSTYVNGSVTPSAALLVRMRGVAKGPVQLFMHGPKGAR